MDRQTRNEPTAAGLARPSPEAAAAALVEETKRGQELRRQMPERDQRWWYRVLTALGRWLNRRESET